MHQDSVNHTPPGGWNPPSRKCRGCGAAIVWFSRGDKPAVPLNATPVHVDVTGGGRPVTVWLASGLCARMTECPESKVVGREPHHGTCQAVQTA